MRKAKHIITGIFLITVGIALWVLPVLPGFVLVVVGYLLLGAYYPFLIKPLDLLMKKNTRMQKIYEQAKQRVRDFL